MLFQISMRSLGLSIFMVITLSSSLGYPFFKGLCNLLTGGEKLRPVKWDEGEKVFDQSRRSLLSLKKVNAVTSREWDGAVIIDVQGPETHEIMIPLSLLREAILDNGVAYKGTRYADGVRQFFDKRISVEFVRSEKGVHYIKVKGQYVIQESDYKRTKEEVLGKDFDFEISYSTGQIKIDGTYWVPTYSDRYTERKFSRTIP